MKKILPLTCIVTILSLPALFANEPDSAWLFSYATERNAGHDGLHFAYSIDGQTWQSIGSEASFLTCDYGSWGSQKRMLTPYLISGSDGLWHCIWSLNEQDNAFAHAASPDLVTWKRQSYPRVASDNCLNPVISRKAGNYVITWISTTDNKLYGCETSDFKTYSAAQAINASQHNNNRKVIELSEGQATGQIHRVAWSQVALLKRTVDNHRYWDMLHNERTVDDPVRFAGLNSVDAKLIIRTGESKPISDLLTGIFFEDINYAADGGLYAELVQNRDFEYTSEDKQGRDPNWNSTHSWNFNGDGAFTIDTMAPVHANNPHYAVLTLTQPGGRLTNTGFNGIALKKGETYDLSLFAKQLDGKGGQLSVSLIGKNGETYAQATTGRPTTGWKKLAVKLTANADVPDARLEIKPLAPGKIALDMVSLFPRNTFKGRKNGLRNDLAQTLADIKPRFVRFPGGCVAHGDGIGNIYRWKNTIGPLESRKPQRNIWNYHQTGGLGYFEYFQFCEDIGAEPLPVLAAGVPCQNSSSGGGGQQGGIPLCDMDEYIQDILDLVEWANGDAGTTKWGQIRAQAGHPKPFNLKYLGIGNEDLITDIFEERFTLIFNTLKEKHPEITVIGTVGPFWKGTDYEEGWAIASKLDVPMVDEHYYQSPGWFIYHQDFYDNYDRSRSNVYLGEYAAHLPGRPNNLETALAEALYMTTLERNGDIVSMASYAPLLARDGNTQWNPDLIYFNGLEVKPTTGYQVQKLFGNNAGDSYISNTLSVNTNDDKVRKRVAVSVVRGSQSGDLIVKLVNLLPVAAKTRVTLDSTFTMESNAQRTILTGKPDGLRLIPVSDLIDISNDFACELPAYSFTVLRIKEKSK